MEIRLASSLDCERLRRLAERDTARVPDGPLLIAERADELLAALSLDSGSAIADPFAPTAQIVAVLRAYAAPSAMSRRTRVGSIIDLLRTEAEHADLARLRGRPDQHRRRQSRPQ